MDGFLNSGVYAILPSWLESFQRTPIESFFIVRPVEETEGPAVKDGILHVTIRGPLSKRPGFATRYMEGTATEAATKAVREAIGNPEVRGIFLHIDSPGGTVDGPSQLAEALMEARKSMKVVAFGDMLASAAYWIASAADRIVVSETATVGSIGVIATHYDMSEADRMRGLKRTPITAGKYKSLSSPAVPLNLENQKALQDEVDAIYSLFVDQVSAGRGVEVDAVLKEMADARIFIGRQAVEAGLVDAVGTMDMALSFLRDARGGKGEINTGGKGMDGAKLKEKISALFAEVKGLKEALDGDGGGQAGGAPDGTGGQATGGAPNGAPGGNGAGQTPTDRMGASLASFAEPLKPADGNGALNEQAWKEKFLGERAGVITACSELGLDANATLAVVFGGKDEAECLRLAIAKAKEVHGGTLAGIGEGGRQTPHGDKQKSYDDILKEQYALFDAINQRDQGGNSK